MKWRLTVLIFAVLAASVAWVKLPINLGLDLQGGTQLILEAKDTQQQPVDQDTVAGILSVVRNRINGLGVSEPVIQQKGMNQIIIELPGVKDPERAITLIGETALLEFIEAEWAPENIQALSNDKQAKLIGDKGRLAFLESHDNQGHLLAQRPIILKQTVLTGADLKQAVPATNSLGQPVVSIEFTDQAAKTFYELTARTIGKPIAIALDGQIISAPNVNAAIAGGKAIIEGGFSVQAMKDLVIQLKAGSLPVPVEIISNKIVGPSLGEDSIRKSKKAGIIGLAVVCVYILILYRGAGIVAIIALLSYLLLDLALLKAISATLTLPGIAGIILTIGMAVDANVIIFERIKDELHKGDSLVSAIQSGFSKGFIAILDSNITTLIAALVLFWLGTGSIKGFALTLSLGICISMFSAIFITKIGLEILAKYSQSRAVIFGMRDTE